MKRGITLIELLVALAIVAVLAAILYPNHMRAKSRSKLMHCRGRLFDLATSLKFYAADNDGFYPTSLRALTPNYLKTIPNCPGAERDTYSAGYASAELKLEDGVVHCSHGHGGFEGRDASKYKQCEKRLEELQAVARASSWGRASQQQQPCPLGGKYSFIRSCFTLQCTGHNHMGSGTPSDFPKYSSHQGLLDH
ncbi:MAG: hypothetical protein AMXMBFR33_47430 [Candidatus Xenobia bacterium]